MTDKICVVRAQRGNRWRWWTQKRKKNGVLVVCCLSARARAGRRRDTNHREKPKKRHRIVIIGLNPNSFAIMERGKRGKTFFFFLTLFELSPALLHSSDFKPRIFYTHRYSRAYKTQSMFVLNSEWTEVMFYRFYYDDVCFILRIYKQLFSISNFTPAKNFLVAFLI